MSEYFLQIGGQQRGPFSRFQLESQPISESTPVRLEGTDQWRRAGDFPELQTLLRGGGSGNQYGDFGELVPEASPYASPRADVRVASSNGGGSTAPKWLGIISCGLGSLAWLILLGFFGFVIYMVIQEQQGGQEPPEEAFVTIGLSFCFNIMVMLAGLIIGGIGILLPGSGKGWAIVGTVLNSLPLLLLVGLILLGFVVS